MVKNGEGLVEDYRKERREELEAGIRKNRESLRSKGVNPGNREQMLKRYAELNVKKTKSERLSYLSEKREKRIVLKTDEVDEIDNLEMAAENIVLSKEEEEELTDLKRYEELEGILELNIKLASVDFDFNQSVKRVKELRSKQILTSKEKAVLEQLEKEGGLINFIDKLAEIDTVDNKLHQLEDIRSARKIAGGLWRTMFRAAKYDVVAGTGDFFAARVLNFGDRLEGRYELTKGIINPLSGKYEGKPFNLKIADYATELFC